MMIGSVTKNIGVKSLESDYTWDMQVSKIDRENLLVLENPKYADEERPTNKPLSAAEIEEQEIFRVKQAQQGAEATDNYERDRPQLNLQPNDKTVLECHGRIRSSTQCMYLIVIRQRVR